MAEAGGFVLLYRGMAVGAMSIVTPIAATAAVLPVAVGLAHGDGLGPIQVAGIALALVGVLVASREDAADGRHPAAGALLGVGAAIGFGVFLVGLDAAGEADPLWGTVVVRFASLATLALACAVRRERVAVERTDLRMLAAVGGLDLLGNGAFAIAATGGVLSVVGVLGSLSPITTVALAADRPARAPAAPPAGGDRGLSGGRGDAGGGLDG